MTNPIEILVRQLAERFIKTSMKLVVAESCTGGSLAENLTRFPGSSSWFDCGFITYSNQSKQEILSVSSDIIEEFGAVSEEVALEMAKGALEKSPADYSVSITGIAGPKGGNKQKPVGLVYIGVKKGNKTLVKKYLFKKKQRIFIQRAAVNKALKLILSFIK